ncbi:MAG: BlaI/MecI/CopY family transcriptional regulator [Planctomycetes bacterium]|nr:BlaI/MecI/CopY family transcriptional regulator [Planctomycetota bacterium]
MHSTRGQITDAIACKRKLAYSTVLTMMRSLEKKGFLSHTEEDRRYVYSALVDEREVTANMVKDVLNRLFNGSRELFLARLFELRDIDEEELKLLKKISAIK